MREVGKSDHQAKWTSLLEAKYKHDGNVEIGEIEKILCEYNVCSFLVPLAVTSI